MKYIGTLTGNSNIYNKKDKVPSLYKNFATTAER